MKEIAKRVHRIYCLLKLNIRRKGKQRLPACNPSPLAVPERLNLSGSVDFMHNAQICMDDYNREALAIVIDLNLPTQRVIRVLDRIVVNRGYPVMGFEVQWGENLR